MAFLSVPPKRHSAPLFISFSLASLINGPLYLFGSQIPTYSLDKSPPRAVTLVDAPTKDDLNNAPHLNKVVRPAKSPSPEADSPFTAGAFVPKPATAKKRKSKPQQVTLSSFLTPLTQFPVLDHTSRRPLLTTSPKPRNPRPRYVIPALVPRF